MLSRCDARLEAFIPTQKKVEYLNSLLQVGFHTLDCGSFVSSKAIPQMADTGEVISALSLGETKTKLLVIVANMRGAEEAVQHENISYLGSHFPFLQPFSKETRIVQLKKV
jgi:hydroxymethylglutaryl-CoA lyase